MAAGWPCGARSTRIDRYEGDQGVYLRVVDYKSSAQRLEPSRMWYGLQLQLLLYLKAATAAGAGEPAGAFYFTVSDPMCDSVQDLKAAAEAAIAKELRLKGVVLADAEVISAMDAEEPGFSVEKVFNADGTVSRNATAVDREEMGALLRHAQKLAAELAGQIRRRAHCPPSRGPGGMERMPVLRIQGRMRPGPQGGGYRAKITPDGQGGIPRPAGE